MRCNGELRFMTVTGGGVNEYGEPTSAVEQWSDPLRCSIKTRTDNRLVLTSDGTEHVSSFDILVEATHAFPWASSTAVELVRLGVLLGRFEVISAESVPDMGRIRLTV